MPAFESLQRLGRRAARAAQRLVAPARDGVAILAYHLVEAGTASPVDLPAARFRAQLEELAGRFEVCSLDDALDRLRGGRRSGPAVVLTFDDAFDNFRTAAWPILYELGLPVTLYVPAGFLDRQIPAPLAGGERLEPLAWEALAELAADPRVIVGSHSYAHGDLQRLPAAEIARDLERARAVLEDRLGRPVPHFCYPRARRSAAAERVVRGIHESAAVAGGRRNRPGTFDPHRLSRIPVRTDMPASLVEVVEASVWLEEWLASGIRRLR